MDFVIHIYSVDRRVTSRWIVLCRQFSRPERHQEKNGCKEYRRNTVQPKRLAQTHSHGTASRGFFVHVQDGSLGLDFFDMNCFGQGIKEDAVLAYVERMTSDLGCHYVSQFAFANQDLIKLLVVHFHAVGHAC